MKEQDQKSFLKKYSKHIVHPHGIKLPVTLGFKH